MKSVGPGLRGVVILPGSSLYPWGQLEKADSQPEGLGSRPSQAASSRAYWLWVSCEAPAP